MHGINTKHAQVSGEVSAGILYVNQGCKLKGNTKKYVKRVMNKIELAQITNGIAGSNPVVGMGVCLL